jgi:DNA-binding CsgD family transcriptional regulator
MRKDNYEAQQDRDLEDMAHLRKARADLKRLRALKYIRDGLSNKEVAQATGCSEHYAWSLRRSLSTKAKT